MGLDRVYTIGACTQPNIAWNYKRS